MAWRGAGRNLASPDPAPKFTLSRRPAGASFSFGEIPDFTSHSPVPTRRPLDTLSLDTQALCLRTGFWRSPFDLLRPDLPAALRSPQHNGCRYVILRCARREADGDGPGDQEGLSQDGHGPPSRHVPVPAALAVVISRSPSKPRLLILALLRRQEPRRPLRP